METIMGKILNGSVKTTQAAPITCNCTHCKNGIDSNYTYVRFAGEYLHNDCLLEYLQKMRLLKIITPEKSEGKS